MNLSEAQRMTQRLMREHGLPYSWTFKFDRSVKRFGQCRYTVKEIGLSEHLARLNDESTVRNTVLHEIAHALVGSDAGHGPIWQAKARQIGCDARRCYDITKVTMPQSKWTGTCPGCGATVGRERLTEKARDAACRRCCRGKYNPAFRLRWQETRYMRG